MLDAADRRRTRANASRAPDSIASAPRLFIDRCCLLDAPGDWRAALAWRGSWTPPELPVERRRCAGARPETRPKVGALLEAVERWWIDGDFSADRAACLAELKRLARHGMIRPSLTFVAVAGRSRCSSC